MENIINKIDKDLLNEISNVDDFKKRCIQY